MDDPNNTTGTLEADEDILTYTVSDEAIEAAAASIKFQFTDSTIDPSRLFCCRR